MRDDIESRSLPIVTVGLIIGCGVVYYFQWVNPETTAQYAFQARQLVSADLFRDPLHVLATLVTSLFLHSPNPMHIIGNMLFLWIFGDNVEDRLGKIRFVLFYGLCGVAANLTQAVASGFRVTVVGASGAIAGVMGAYFVSFPGSRIGTFIFPWSLLTGLIPIPARFFIVLWIVIQILAGAGALPGQPGNVAWFAHIGGFFAGWVLCRWMAPKPRSRPRGPHLEWIEER